MNTTEPEHPQESAAISIDLMPYFSALVDARWAILLTALLCGTLMGVWSYSIPYMFQSGAKISVVDIEDPGGVSPDDRRASEVLTLVEHGFVMGTTRDNHNAVMRARLSSRHFTQLFIDQFNLYRHFYPDYWDEETEQWTAGFTPDRGESYTRFRDNIRLIDHDELTDIITVNMRWPDAVLARDWANLYVETFNEFIRGRTMLEVERKQAFLQKELRNADVVEIQQSIYRLVEAQTAIAMLASAREEYAVEIIDPAALPYKSFNLSRKYRVVMATTAGALLAAFAVLAIVLIHNMLDTLLAYRKVERLSHNAHLIYTPLNS